MQMLRRMKAFALLFALQCAAAALPARAAPQAAANPPYLAEMPSVERVKAEIKGGDAMDTAARQMGAFWQLQEVIKGLAGRRYYGNQLTPGEKHWLGQYAWGYQAAGQPYANYPDRPKWYQMHAFYETDAGFLEDVMNRFFSPGLRAQVIAMKGEAHARALARGRAAEQQRAQAQQPQSPPQGQAGRSGQQEIQDAAQALQKLAEGISEVIAKSAPPSSAPSKTAPSKSAASKAPPAPHKRPGPAP